MLDFDRLSRVAGLYQRRIEEQGFILRLSDDLALLERCAEDMGFAVTPHFSTGQNTFTRPEAFWAGVFDQDDTCAAMVACKVQRLGRETLTGYSQRYWARIYPEEAEGPVALAATQKRVMDEMTGTLVYCGEFRTHPKHQKSGLGVGLAGYIKPAAFLHWPDARIFYIYMEDKDAKTGLLNHIGLTRQIPNAWNFAVSPGPKPPHYWMALIGRADLDDLIDVDLQIGRC